VEVVVHAAGAARPNKLFKQWQQKSRQYAQSGCFVIAIWWMPNQLVTAPAWTGSLALPMSPDPINVALSVMPPSEPEQPVVRPHDASPMSLFSFVGLFWDRSVQQIECWFLC
jgi:hypothetical protein